MTSDVDVSGPAGDARREAERHPADPTYRELMAAYAELGELLDSGRSDAEFEAECRELVGALIALDRVSAVEFEARLAIRYATW